MDAPAAHASQLHAHRVWLDLGGARRDPAPQRYHRAILGPIEDPLPRGRFGSRYDARDPELSLWVHATLVESVATAYEAWIAPLPAEERSRLYDESRPIGRAFGIPESLLPADLDAFDRYFADMRGRDGPVHPRRRRLANSRATSSRRDSMHWIPSLGWVPPTVYSWLQWPAVALLPEDLREEFAIPWSPVHDAVAAWLKSGMSAWRPLVPPAPAMVPAGAPRVRAASRQ